MTQVRITYRPTGLLLAEGPLGWDVTPFEGNFYIRRKYLCTNQLRINYIPGLCIYKFLYVWLDLHLDENQQVQNFAWLYWLPNPLLPFIWFRVAIPRTHPDIAIEEY